MGLMLHKTVLFFVAYDLIGQGARGFALGKK